MIIRPAAYSTPANSPSSASPPQAYSGHHSIQIGSSSSAGQHAQSNQQSVPGRGSGPGIGIGGSTAVTLQQSTVTHKWLELCIRSGPDTFVLGEIDVVGRQTDQSVFKKIRAKYQSNRTAARLFGCFASRIPNGGVFVQVSIT